MKVKVLGFCVCFFFVNVFLSFSHSLSFNNDFHNYFFIDTVFISFFFFQNQNVYLWVNVAVLKVHDFYKYKITLIGDYQDQNNLDYILSIKLFMCHIKRKQKKTENSYSIERKWKYRQKSKMTENLGREAK